MSDILTAIGHAAALEQLAEEATELAHAALKVARIFRDDNPTPVSPTDAYLQLKEEYTDVEIAAMVIGLDSDADVAREKLERWQGRLRAAGKL